MLLDDLQKKNLIHPPKWMSNNTTYLVVMGSQAYGVNDDSSDLDVYGFCIPHKDILFPHLAGYIPGFGTQSPGFDQWMEHHVADSEKKVEYDLTVYNIVKYFDLCMNGNPNMIDSLFVPRNCVIHSTHVGEIVRENRKKFLHKGAWPKFKGYAYSSMSKIRNKVNSSNPKRAANIEKFGFDTKFGYHCIRLLAEIEQIMIEGDLDLQRNREQLKSIRRGEWSLDQLETYFTEKELFLEKVYAESKLPAGPDESAIKELLMQCLEEHYGDLGAVVTRNKSVNAMVREIETVLAKYS